MPDRVINDPFGLVLDPSCGYVMHLQGMCVTIGHMFGLLREPRIVVGIALMIIATATGGLYMQHATARIAVWQTDHAVAAGTVLGPGDVHLTDVAGDVRAYAVAGSRVLGRAVSRPLEAGELLPAAALRNPATAYDDVMVPAASLHMPDDLVRGELVDVWLSTDDPSVTVRVLAAVRVLRTISADVGGGRGVALAVPPKRTASLIAAVHLGDLDLVRVSR